MKKYLLIVLLFWVWSCTEAPKFSPEEFEFQPISFKKFSDKGFLFTPNSYDRQYQSIGMVDASIYPEANLQNTESGSPTGRIIYWLQEPVNMDKALDSLYEACVQMGADALVQLKFRSVSKIKYKSTTKPLEVFGVNIKGFAIKRN